MSAEQAEQRYRQQIESISESDVERAAEAGRAKVEQFGQNIPDPLVNLWETIRLLISLLGDYVAGRYRQIPWTSLAAIAAAILYFVSPVDVIPDFIPVVGYVDDAAVFAMCVKLIQKDLQAYRDWLNSLIQR